MFKSLSKVQLLGACKIVAAALIGGATGWFWPNNPAEQYAEQYIETHTGMKLNFTDLEGTATLVPK